MLWLPLGCIHTNFVSETWTGAWSGWSFQLSTPFRNLWARSLPDGSGLCGALPAAAEPACQAAAAIVLGEAVLKGGLDVDPHYVSWALPLPSLPGHWLCAVRRVHRVVEDGCLVPLATDAQAQSLWALAAVASWPGVLRSSTFSINGLWVSTY